jgi:hypothetical protein
MNIRIGLSLAMALVLTACAAQALADEASGAAPAVVCNVKVLSDKVKDVSSLDAWKKSYIKDTYEETEFVEPIRPYIKSVIESKTIPTDVKKDMLHGIMVWQTVSSYQHQDSPPSESLGDGGLVIDPLKIANVYGYSFCSVAASEVAALARQVGLKSKGWTINRHCVIDVYWGGKGHLLDSSLLNFFPKSDGDIASVAEICAAVQGFRKDHPELTGADENQTDAKLREFHFANNRTGWKRGPELLANCPLYNARGWWPAATHGWYSTMQEYDGGGKEKTPFEYLSGHTTGYSVNIQLREGEALTRNWFNKGLHVNMKEGKAPGCLDNQKVKDLLKHAAMFGDIAPGRIGNGTIVYQPPMGALGQSAARYENLSVTAAADHGSPFLIPKDASKPGALVIRMPSSYVYLSGKLSFNLIGMDKGGTIAVSFSDDNGLDWKEVPCTQKDGMQEIDLTSLVFRRYDYRLRFEFKGAIGLGSLVITHDIQHSQRPLPALLQGDNTITFSAGPQESTMSLEASMNASNKGKNLIFTDFHPEIVSLDGQKVSGTGGSMTFPVSTPGDITRLRIGCNWRTSGPESGFSIEVSFDDGKTFKAVAPFGGNSDKFDAQHIEVTDIPAGTRAAKVRFTAVRKQDIQLLTYHVNTDYKQPNSGFRPVKVTYLWDENGTEKKDVHVATKPQETYTIKCEAKPLMKTIILELAK